MSFAGESSETAAVCNRAMVPPTGDIAEADLIASLQSQIESLRNRVKEVESDNVRLKSLLSSCHCNKVGGNIDALVEDSVNSSGFIESLSLSNGKSKSRRKKKKKKRNQDHGTISECRWSKRYVALKVMYFGKRFFGFASEVQMDPTVEGEIFKALEETRLINGNKKDLNYARCGRTDKGVSSVGQVISLFLRSNLKEALLDNGAATDKELHEAELDYVRLLNRALPKDIRIMGWCPVPTDFSARFSCSGREYKYFFWRRNLDVLAMERACKKFIGEHDFRNFCKMDATNVHTYRRSILVFEMFPCNERFEEDELWVVKIKGTAFLWHQVRCMVAVLFLIGQGLESPNVVDALLDIERIPRKPQYLIAPETPLVLQSCEFEDLRFMCSERNRQALQAHFEMECRSYKLEAAIHDEALQSCSLIENDNSNFIYKTKKKAAAYVPLISRLTEPSYEERRTKLISVVHE